MKVSDAMSKKVDYVTLDTKVKEVSLLIFGRGINGVPVCKNKKVVGFVTERDILARFYPTMAEYADDPLHSSDFVGMEGKIQEIFEMTVDKVMSENPTTITPDTPLLRAQSSMFIEKVGRLPVVNKKGRLIGMITKGDVFRALVGDKLLFTESQDYNDWLSKTYYQAVDIDDRLKHEMPDLLKVFSKNNVKSVIDIGCGTGDHAIDLARRGFRVVGIDRSRGMINEANIRKQVLSEEAKKRVKFYCGSFEHMVDKLKQPLVFDAALFMGNTISHNPHVHKEVIKKTTKYLSKHGIIVLQITNFQKVLEVHKRLLSFNFAKIKDEPDKEYAFLEFYDLPIEHKQTILKTFAVLVSESGKRWKSAGVRNSLMAYSTKESIKDILKKNGFSNISFYGGLFDGRKWDWLFRKPFKYLEHDWLNVLAVK